MRFDIRAKSGKRILAAALMRCVAVRRLAGSDTNVARAINDLSTSALRPPFDSSALAVFTCETAPGLN
jgi:hypothetical protein